ncbi:amidohydrolase [Nocardioides maradonensis]
MRLEKVTGVRVHGQGVVDVLVEDGRIRSVEPTRGGRSDAKDLDEAAVDGAGGLLLPTLVDAHCHPDKTTWGEPWVSRMPAASLEELIENDVRLQLSMTTPVATRTARLMDQYVARGARALRAHVDVAPVHGLGNVAGVAEAAAQLVGVLDVEIVAFPQLGILRTPGTAALLRDAVSAGARLIGGIDPVGLDGDLAGHLDIVFGLAERLGVGLDIHLHDRGREGIEQVEEIIRRTTALGMQGLVTIGHAFCFHDCPPDELPALAEATAAAGITLATAALGEDGMIPVAELRAAGVRVVLGSDGVRDAWSPFGNADMIDRTHLLAWHTGAVTDDDLETCLAIAAEAGADLLGLPRSGLAPGDPADFMLVDAESPAQAVVDRPAPRWVARAGRLVARDGRVLDSARTTTVTTRTS